MSDQQSVHRRAQLRVSFARRLDIRFAFAGCPNSCGLKDGFQLLRIDSHGNAHPTTVRPADMGSLKKEMKLTELSARGKAKPWRTPSTGPPWPARARACWPPPPASALCRSAASPTVL